MVWALTAGMLRRSQYSKDRDKDWDLISHRTHFLVGYCAGCRLAIYPKQVGTYHVLTRIEIKLVNGGDRGEIRALLDEVDPQRSLTVKNERDVRGLMNALLRAGYSKYLSPFIAKLSLSHSITDYDEMFRKLLNRELPEVGDELFDRYIANGRRLFSPRDISRRPREGLLSEEILAEIGKGVLGEGPEVGRQLMIDGFIGDEAEHTTDDRFIFHPERRECHRVIGMQVLIADEHGSVTREPNGRKGATKCGQNRPQKPWNGDLAGYPMGGPRWNRVLAKGGYGGR
jgi:hypothetical protein